MSSPSPRIAKNLQREMAAWRHDFHRHPDTGFAVERTATIVENILRECGANPCRVADVGVVGVLRRGTKKHAIGLRAELDALPITEASQFHHRSVHDGKMHACGHDGHAAMLLGAARQLAIDGKFDGTVVFIFQPDEENGLGAEAMLNDGLLEKFPMNQIFGMHNLPSLPTGHFTTCPGPIMASEDRFQIAVVGRGGHAALPHLCTDALVAGAEIVGALQTVVSRTINSVLGGVVSVTNFQTINGAQNVIPSRIVLSGDARAYSAATRRDICRAIKRIARGICDAHRVKIADFTYENCFDITTNSTAETQSALAAAREVAGNNRVTSDCPRMMFSEDFGRMLNVRPGCFMFIGNGKDSAALHNPYFDFNDEILATGAAYWTQLAEQELS